LYGLGLLLALYPRFNVSTVRIMGVLPRLALCYLAAALFYRAIATADETRRVWLTLTAAATLLAGYWALMTFVPAPGGIAGDLTPSGNLGAWIDRTLLGEAHLWRQSRTWDPEGLLSTLPAVATALTGLAAGMVLVQPLHSSKRPASPEAKPPTFHLLAWGVASIVAGLAWDRSFPINKNLWTSSYVLFTSGLASMALGALYWWIDARGRRAFTRSFIVMGVNALALFVVSGWLVKTLIFVTVTGGAGERVSLYRAIFEHAFAPLASPRLASLFFAVAALAVLYVMLEVMYRRRWFLRA
jgi:predicted acyltransferase